MRQENQASQAYLLLDFVQRLERRREGRRAVHIHLSLLSPQNRREHHVRLAINTFDEQVKQYEGRIFALENADLVFVWRDTPLEELGEPVRRLRYLFTDDPLLQAVDDDGHDKFSTWYELEEQFPEFQTVVEGLYADGQTRAQQRSQTAGRNGQEADVRTPLKPEVLGKLENFLASADLSNVMRRQAVCVVAGELPPQPVFNEVFISIGELASTVVPDVDLGASRWLFQHLTQTLDLRMLKMLSRADDSSLQASFSMNLNVGTLLTPEFLDFDSTLRVGSRGTIIVELQQIDMFADLQSYIFARDFVQGKGYKVCLDGMTDLTMQFIDREKLGLDLIKLIWTPDMGEDAAAARRKELREMIEAAGNTRIILCRCDTPAAVRLGQSLGITMFQGRHIDSVLRNEAKRGNAPAPRRRDAG